MHGRNSSACAIANVSPFGVWVLVNQKEYFLDHKRYPWFRGVLVEDILNVESPREGHLRWPSLDIDLHLDSIEFPERYPLVAQVPLHKAPARRSVRRRRMQ